MREMDATNACQSSPRKARYRKIPANKIEIQKTIRLRGEADCEGFARMVLKIDAFPFNYQRTFHHLCIDRANVFPNDTKEE